MLPLKVFIMKISTRSIIFIFLVERVLALCNDSEYHDVRNSSGVSDLSDCGSSTSTGVTVTGEELTSPRFPNLVNINSDLSIRDSESISSFIFDKLTTIDGVFQIKNLSNYDSVFSMPSLTKCSMLIISDLPNFRQDLDLGKLNTVSVLEIKNTSLGSVYSNEMISNLRRITVDNNKRMNNFTITTSAAQNSDIRFGNGNSPDLVIQLPELVETGVLVAMSAKAMITPKLERIGLYYEYSGGNGQPSLYLPELKTVGKDILDPNNPTVDVNGQSNAFKVTNVNQGDVALSFPKLESAPEITLGNITAKSIEFPALKDVARILRVEGAFDILYIPNLQNSSDPSRVNVTSSRPYRVIRETTELPPSSSTTSSTSNAPSSSSSKKSLSKGAIAGIAVSVVVIVVAFGLLVVYLVSRRRRKIIETSAIPEPPTPSPTAPTMEKHSMTGVTKCHENAEKWNNGTNEAGDANTHGTGQVGERLRDDMRTLPYTETQASPPPTETQVLHPPPEHEAQGSKWSNTETESKK